MRISFKRCAKRYKGLLISLIITGCVYIVFLERTVFSSVTDDASVKRVIDKSSFKIFQERRNTLLHVCQKNESAYVGLNNENIVRHHFVVDRKHKFVYCAMEKVGSTFWRRLFQIISDSSKAKSPFDIPAGQALGGHVETFHTMAFDDIHNILGSSRTFVITRDPYTRLYSGYMDKLFSANLLFWGGIGKFITHKLRSKASNKSIACGHDATFPEFVKYFIFSETFNKHRDGHFTPMYDHCRPCQIKYDIIAKMESFSEDTLSVLKILNMTSLHDTLATQFLQDTRDDSFKDQTEILFNSFKRTKGCLSIYENQKRMWTKFKSRGLISKYAIFPFSSAESESLTPSKYINALKQSVKETKEKATSNRYKYEYLTDAYAEVPKEDLRRLHKILKKDCDVFGYDCEGHPWIENAYRTIK